MKKLVLLCISLALFAGQSVAQVTGVTPNALSNEQLKERMAINAPLLYKKYNSASTLSGFGAGLTIGGVAALIIGAVTADKETTKDETGTHVTLSGTGGAVSAAGFVCILAGTPIWIIGSTKKKNARNAYLREFGYDAHVSVSPSPYFQLNAARNNVGLAFVF